MTHLGAAAIPIERGCGRRFRAGIYLECGLSDNGLPIEYFLIDPPQPIGELALPNRGVILMERKGIWHVVDRVGLSGYLNVADFVEEVRRYGASRRAQSNLDFSKLGLGSRLLLVHPRAYIENNYSYPDRVCPKGGSVHAVPQNEMCAGLWWHDIEGGEPTSWWRDDVPAVMRKMPSFQYFGYAHPQKVEPVYHDAFFMSLPLTRIAVVKGDHEKNLAKARAAQVPVAEVEV